MITGGAGGSFSRIQATTGQWERGAPRLGTIEGNGEMY